MLIGANVVDSFRPNTNGFGTGAAVAAFANETLGRGSREIGRAEAGPAPAARGKGIPDGRGARGLAWACTTARCSDFTAGSRRVCEEDEAVTAGRLPAPRVAPIGG